MFKAFLYCHQSTVHFLKAKSGLMQHSQVDTEAQGFCQEEMSSNEEKDAVRRKSALGYR